MSFHESLLQGEVQERHLLLKRRAFLEEYGLADRPALVLQCSPLSALQVDVTSESVQTAFRLGKGSESNDAWWNGFRDSSLPSPVFDGIASSREVPREWATQLHDDGHLLAGVWKFANVEVRTGVEQTAIPKFFSELFKDFSGLVRGCYSAASVDCPFLMTCTLEHADRLALVSGQGRVLAPAQTRKVLRWPVAKLQSLEEVDTVVHQMATRLLRAYGKQYQPG